MVEALLALQRSAGNAAVASLLDERRNRQGSPIGGLQTQAGNEARSRVFAANPKAPPAMSATGPGPRPASRTLAVQRSVGYEFETSWYVSKADGSAFDKYDPIFTGVGWRMEADTPSEGTSDVEFVVKPPLEETNAGRNTLHQVLPAIQAHFQNMIGAAGGQGNLLQGAHANPFVDGGLQNQVKFKAGDTTATPQTTVGVRLERLVPLLQQLSTPNSDANAELMGLAGRHAANAQMLNAVVGAVEGTPTTLSLRDWNRGFGYTPSAAMKGLVSLLIMYLRRGAAIPGVDPYAQAFKYAKIVAIVMARTDFAGMFRQLPDTEKDYYRSHPDHWVDFVLEAARASLPGASILPGGNVIARGLKGDPPKYNKKGVVAKPGKVIAIPLNREDWLKGILVEQDLLNADTFARYKPKEKVQFSGAFGALGMKTDDVGAAQAHKGVIIELREVKHDRDYQDWEQFAEDVFNYIELLNAYDPAGGGAAPQYTKTATPGRGVRA